MSRSRPAPIARAALAALLFAPAALAEQPRVGPRAGPIPPPYATPSAVNFSEVVGWPDGLAPEAPPGFRVTSYAAGLDSPRWMLVLPGGDVLVAEARTEPKAGTPADKAEGQRRSGAVGRSANRITLLHGVDAAGAARDRTAFLDGLNQPMGMALVGDVLYVADTDAVLRFPYRAGETRIAAPGQKVLDLPAGGYNNHWNRNLLPAPDGSKLYVTVGSASNAGEHGLDKEARRANILEVNPDGSGERVFASGLRNPQGMGWAPGTTTLWTVVNERDELGDELVPDYLTSVQDGGFYGWPFSYHGQHPDPRLNGQRPDLVARAIVPDYPLGSHTASLGLAFYGADAFPPAYRGGAFIGQHGSWNRSTLSGYRVLFIPFRDGRPSGPAQDFLTGFVKDERAKEVYGRPVGVAVAADGALLVADDAGGRIWRVAADR